MGHSFMVCPCSSQVVCLFVCLFDGMEYSGRYLDSVHTLRSSCAQTVAVVGNPE